MRRYSRSAAHNYGGYHHHYILNVSINASVFVALIFDDTVTAKCSYGILTSFLHILLVGMRRDSRSAAHNYGGYHHRYILNVSNNATVFVASLFDTVTAKSSYGILTSFLHILLVGMLLDCSIPTRKARLPK